MELTGDVWDRLYECKQAFPDQTVTRPEADVLTVTKMEVSSNMRKHVSVMPVMITHSLMPETSAGLAGGALDVGFAFSSIAGGEEVGTCAAFASSPETNGA